MREKRNIAVRLCFVSIFSLAILFLCCRKEKTDETRIDRIMEDGVEVILNHLAPYKIKGEPTDFDLKEELTINFGSPEIGELGIADATDFDVDRKGFIYFFHPHQKGNTIFKFGPDGKFLKSWGMFGQGPSELRFISSSCLTDRGSLMISDHASRKLVWFTDEGKPLKEVKYPPDGRYFIINPIINEDRLVGRSMVLSDVKADYVENVFYLIDGDLAELKKLDVFKQPSPLKKPRRGINYNAFFTAKATAAGLFIGNKDRGYEILKFDPEGNLLRKIRKEYVPARVPEDVLKKRKERLEKSGQPYYLPKTYLPICDFFPDEDGRLFVMTFERGEAPGEYWYDIFDAGGVFIGRKSLHLLNWGEIGVCAAMKRGRLYCFEESGDGFNVFKVYKVAWK